MKIEKEKQEYNSLFKDVKIGQCFKHWTGNFFIKTFESTSLSANCACLTDGFLGTCCGADKVKIFENAKVVLNESKNN